MLVISSTLARRDLGRRQGRLHELKDQRGLAAGVAAWSRTILDPDALPEVLAEANALFRSGRPRPVHIEIPLDVITAEAGPPLPMPSPPSRPAPEPAAIAAAAELLAGARTRSSSWAAAPRSRPSRRGRSPRRSMPRFC